MMTTQQRRSLTFALLLLILLLALSLRIFDLGGQSLWNDEDERMRFSIEGNANADAQAFALSPLGKKYFTTVILNLTGIVNRRIGEVAMQRPAALVRFGGAEQRFLEGFKREPA